jgi:hypothetical protein
MPTAPVFDSIGAGQQISGANPTISFSHPAMGPMANCILVSLAGINAGWGGTMKIGSTTIPLIGTYNWTTYPGYLQWYGLIFPPGTFIGPQTVSIQPGNSTSVFFTCNSIAYSGVVSIGEMQGGQGTGTAVSHPVYGIGIGQVLVEAMSANFSAAGQAFSAFNGVSRWNIATTAGTGEGGLIGESTPAVPGNGTFAATLPASLGWGACSLTLYGAGFALPAAFNSGDVYSNAHVNAVAAAINTLVNGPARAFVATSEGTTSTTYTDLSTVTDTVTVTIGQSGNALVFLTIGGAYANIANGDYYCSFAASGANTIAAGPPYEIWGQTATGAAGTTVTPMCGAFLVPGLAPGATTFKMKYKAGGGASTAFSARTIVVVPFP